MSNSQSTEENATALARGQARSVLIAALATDMTNTLGIDATARYQFARDGHVGFAMMEDKDLIRHAENAGLEFRPVVAEAIEQLS